MDGIGNCTRKRPPLKIVNLHLSSSATREQFSEIKGLFGEGQFRSNTIFLVDFNARSAMWCDSVENPNGKILRETLEDYNNLIILNSDAAAVTTIHNSIIDLVIATNDIAPLVNLEVDTSLSSDHFAVNVKYNRVLQKNTMCHIPRWKFSKADWQNYQICLDTAMNDLLIEFQEISELNMNLFNQKITELIYNAARKTIPRTGPAPYPGKGWYWDDFCTAAARLNS